MSSQERVQKLKACDASNNRLTCGGISTNTPVPTIQSQAAATGSVSVLSNTDSYIVQPGGGLTSSERTEQIRVHIMLLGEDT
jgi:hypothetical protein